MERPLASHPGARPLRAATLVVVCALWSAGCGGSTDGSVTATAPSTAPLPPTTSPSDTTGPVYPGTTHPSTGTTAATTSTAAAEPSPTSTSTSLPGWWRPVDAERPLRVWVLGDSLAETVGAALGRWGAATDWAWVTLDYEKGSGLVRSDAFDWPAAVIEVLGDRDADAVVVVLGANDGQALRLPGRWLDFGTPEWDAEYTRRVGAFIDLLLGGAARVYWVGVPVMADPEYDGRVQHLNEVQRAEALAHRGVAYVDAYSLLQAEGGGFAWELPDIQGNLVEVRLPDGVHLTTAGAERVAGMVLSAITDDWRVPGG